ncbi:lipid-A-disaccharide synthase [Cognatishimia activa]|uniref:Lipid-A-disaccharide synthase n=1 Tax=Cognatishimia activa TaxID=1715691 RepID=A0A0N7MBH0_9RHOB|nr:lipid-A-disaccharide synthase [Cognatishimia activa]CUJ23669.1 Lipid-A-disaccharide synthase [Cognatishimia activa]CUK25384.1 Lipid-A-disaccharide synthase [Cognatishimia activa]
MKIYLIAGELSGDKLGASLMQGLKALRDDLEFHGVGGPLMEAEGLESQFPMQELSVMGIAEVLPKYFHLKRRIRECADAVIALQPDVMITIDSPDFCLRVAKLVKAAGDTRTVHYVAPSVWAWRPKRADKMAKSIDQVLALLPFEPPYMEAAGMRCDFVGHPVVNEPVARGAEAQAFRDMLGLPDAPIALILPGSRKSEVTRLLPIFVPAMDALAKSRPDLRFVLPTTGPVAEIVKEQVAAMAQPPVILDPTGQDLNTFAQQKRAAFKAANVALAASGTVSLELAASETPMVIAYDVSPISRMIFKRMLRIDTVTLANLITDTRVIPEHLAENCTVENIVPSVLDVLEQPDAQLQVVRDTMDKLGKGGEDPGLRAAKAVLDGLDT